MSYYQKIGFIGAGNMGGSILKGLIASGAANREDILVTQATPELTAASAEQLGVMGAASNRELVENCDLFFLGVEPSIVPVVLEEIKLVYNNSKTIISMAAGVMIASIEKFLGEDAKIIRIMPNTPARVMESMIAMCRNQNITDEEMGEARKILSSIGKAEEVTEDLIHAVIGVSGSSPAYTYMYIQGLADSAAAQGMDPELARVFAAQAVLGAAKIVLESEDSLDTLVDKVCTPGGTTYEAVTYLREHGFREMVTAGAEAAIRKSEEMSRK